MLQIEDTIKELVHSTKLEVSELKAIGSIIFILVTNYWYIPYEERTMEQTFGNEYKVYQSKVRRWI